MSRDLTTTTINALDDEVIYPFFAVELRFDSQTLRLWTGSGNFYDGNVNWLGAGQLLNISSIEETQEIAAKGASITLSGIPSDLLAAALTTPYQGRVCKIYFGVRGSTVFNELFSGYMDQMNIEDGAETGTIQVNVENKLIDLERARVARFTSGYQKSLYPNDLGFDFVEGLQDKITPWGRSAS